MLQNQHHRSATKGYLKGKSNKNQHHQQQKQQQQQLTQKPNQK